MTKRTMYYDGREFADWKQAVAARPLAAYRIMGEWFQIDPETAQCVILKGYCS